MFDDAQKYLKNIIDENIMTCEGSFGLFPAASEGDDVKVFDDPGMTEDENYIQIFKESGTKRKRCS